MNDERQRDGARTLSRNATAADVRVLVEFVLDACRDARVPEDALGDVRLAVEEACTNVVSHGYDSPGGPITLVVRPVAGSVWIEISDHARRFTPSTVPRPDDRDWRDRQPGGLGWHLIGKVMDDVRHDYENGIGNRLTLVKRFVPTPVREAPDA